MTKYFVLDTNVLIHNPQALNSFADNNVVIPMTVIEELDTFKSASDKKGMHSRQVLREIDSLVKKDAITKGARMKNGGTLWIKMSAEKIQLPGMSLEKNDNKILSVAKEIQEQGGVVFFISKDLNARIKAEALGIKARDYEKQQVEYTSLYTGWKDAAVNKDIIAEVYREGKFKPKGFTLLENQYCRLLADKESKTSAICRYNFIDGVLEPLTEKCDAMGITPLNMEQRFAMDLLLNPSVSLVTLVGQAGSGKTLIAIATALAQTIDKKPLYEKILIARPIIPMGKDIGYLPGDKEQKLSYWMQPIFDNLSFIMKRSKSDANNKDTAEEAVQYLLKTKIIEIEALTYIRGRSIPNQFMIVDEAQNLTPHEVKTIISRAGEHTKIVMTGDPDQIDNPYLDANSNGLTYAVERLKGKSLFGHILLSKSERSPLASLAVENL